MHNRIPFPFTAHVLITCLIGLLGLGANDVLSEPRTQRVFFYVSENGSDRLGSGSEQRPWATLAHACKQVSTSGSVIQLQPGNYSETRPCLLVKGVSILGGGREKTIVRSRLKDWLIYAVSEKVESGNQEISSFAIDGLNRSLEHGITVQRRHHVDIKSMAFRDIEATAIQVTGDGGNEKSPPRTYVQGINISNNSFTNCAKDYQTWSGGCVEIGQLDGSLIFGNQIEEDKGYGIKQVGGGWFKRTKIYGNKIRVPDHDALWGSDITIELWNVSDDCEVFRNITSGWVSLGYGTKGGGKYSVRVYDNEIRIENSENTKEAIELVGVSDAEIFRNSIEGAKFGVAMWSGASSRNNLIHHNVIANRADGEGVRIHRGENNKIYNNTFHHLSKALGMYPTPTDILNTEFRNNLVIDTQYGVIPDGDEAGIYNTVMVKNNFFNVAKSFEDWGYRKATVLITASSSFNPGLRNEGQNPYYPVSALSAVVDAGMDVGLPYCGKAPDIGAYEWCGE